MTLYHMLRCVACLAAVGIAALMACDSRRTEPGGVEEASRTGSTQGPEAPAWSMTPDSLTGMLRLVDGRTLAFRSDTSEQSDRPVRHRYVGVLPRIGYHVIEQLYYEGWNYLLVHPATGDTTTVWKPPIVSPSGRYLLVVSMDLSAGYVPTLVQVWSLRSDTLTRVWEVETADYEAGEGWGASNPRWESDTVARVMKHPFHGGRLTADSAAAWIVRTSGGWKVQERAPDT
jgi:hypothetical protein